MRNQTDKKTLGKRAFLFSGILFTANLMLMAMNQQQFPIEHHKVTVRLKLVDVIVVSKRGKFVPGLTASDFEVYEDGWPRPIQSLELITLKSREELLKIIPDMKISEEIKLRKRLWIIFDCLNTEAVLMRRAMARLSDVLSRLAAEGYEMTILKFDYDEGLKVLTDFTNDVSKIKKALEKIESSSPATFLKRSESGEWKRSPETLDETLPETTSEELERLQWRNLLQKTLSCLLASIQMIKESPGRKQVLLLSSGLPEQESNPYFNRIGLRNLRFFDPFRIIKSDEYTSILKEVINYANANKISFYCFNPGEAAVVQSNFAFSHLTRETGGLQLTEKYKPENLVEIIKRESDQYYEIAYKPATKEEDGKFHRVELKVKREGLTVRSRAGYTEYPEEEKRKRELAASFFSPEFYKDIDFNLKLTAWPEKKNSYLLWGKIRVSLLPLKETNLAQGKINFLLGLKEIAGERVHLGEELLDLSQDLKAGTSYFDYYFVTTKIKIKPGRYEAVAILRTDNNKTGAKKIWLELPDLSQKKDPTLINFLVGRLLQKATKGKPFTFDSYGLLNLSSAIFLPCSSEEVIYDRSLAILLQVYEPVKQEEKPDFFLDGQNGQFNLPASLLEKSIDRRTGCKSLVYVCSLAKIPPGEYQLSVRGLAPSGSRSAIYLKINR
jgi:VWFA-related protein